MPEPHTETDYLVVGSAATFLSLAVLFVVLITTWIRTSDTFFKRREKPVPDNQDSQSPEPPAAQP